MTLLPGEKRVLERLAGDLITQEPRLISMFGIFTRLAASDGRPPKEAAIPRPGRHAADQHPSPRWLLVVLIIAAALLAVILIISLTGLI